MKNILIVAESEKNTKCMMEKALRLAPEVIQVVYFESNKSSVATIQTTLQSITKDHCQAEVIISVGSTLKEQTQALTKLVENNKTDMVFIHRPKRGSEEQDFFLIKAVLKIPTCSKILLSSDKSWPINIKALGTLDLSDDNPVQNLLNGRVIQTTANLADAMQAEVSFLTVSAISKISKELVLTSPSEVMATKGKATKEKLDLTIKAKVSQLTFSSHVSAGNPAVEIARVSRKLHSNLVIIGNVGRTGIKGLIVGNTAEKILNRLTTDALIIK